MSSRALAEGEADGAASAAPPPPSAFPCRNSNNCPQGPSEKRFKLRRSGTHYRGQPGFATTATITTTETTEGVDRDGRAWEQREDGTWVRIMGGLSSGEAKRALALRMNVEGFATHYERERCGFLTLTAARDDDHLTPQEFGKRWHEMRKRNLEWVRSYVRVIEAQKRGAPHYHLMVATPWDMKPDQFNWDALVGSSEARKRGDLREAARLGRIYSDSATPEMRACWDELRSLCAEYKLGRSEFLPFRKNAGALANYVGKYLEKGLSFRKDTWKGARRVEYDRKESRSWKRCGSSFGWVSPGAKAWRRRVKELASAVGARDLDEMAVKLGTRWGYHLRGSIMTDGPQQWWWYCGYLAQEFGGTNIAVGACKSLDRDDSGKLVATFQEWTPDPSGTAEPESPAKG